MRAGRKSLARKVGFNYFRDVKKIFKDAGRLEELEDLTESCRPEAQKNLVRENYHEREAPDVSRCLESKESFRNFLDEPFYIYRVPWVNPLDEDSRKTVEEQVQAFEDFYYSH